MTIVSANIENNTFTLSVEGHSGYAEAGSDIVCAAVSTLVQTLHKCLSAVEDDIEKCVIESCEETASYYFDVKAKQKSTDYIDALFFFALSGLKTLSNTYPQNVKFYPLINGQ